MNAGLSITKSIDAILLAGGQSRRMGHPKTLLPWQRGVLLEEVAHVLQPIFRNVLVVGRPDTPLPPLPGLRVLNDEQPQATGPAPDLRGPLVGIATGLMASGAPWCFVAPCDMPFLRAESVLAMARHLQGCDALVLQANGHAQPLHAFYSRDCLPRALALLRRGKTAPMALLDIVRVRVIDRSQLGESGPADIELWDLDTPEQYAAALAVTGTQQESRA